MVMRLLIDFEESIARSFDKPRVYKLTSSETEVVEQHVREQLERDYAQARQKRANRYLHQRFRHTQAIM